jgi:predicted nucleotidyltransferase
MVFDIITRMVSLIEEHFEALEQLCAQYKVQRLEVFGSASTGEKFDPQESDLDFLVEFLPLRAGEYADAYFGLLHSLEDMFGRHVDLVMTRAIKNPYFLESINQNRKLLYAA